MSSISNTGQRVALLCAGITAVFACGAAYAASAGDQWPAPGGDDSLSRHSTLTDINKSNADKMQMAWSMSTTATRGHEGQPLVIGNMMYFVSAYPNHVFAVDLSEADNYQVAWKYSPKQDDHAVAVACCDTVNRGLVYGDGKVVFNTLDGQVIALDAKTGKEVWKVKRADPKKGETSTPAPIIVKDIVISGMGGDEFGARGRMQAYSLKDGHEMWTCHSTGSDKDVCLGKDFNKKHPEYGGLGDLGISSYPGDEWKRGGGAPWGWISYDPKLDLIYYGTGNPGLWSPTYRCKFKTHEECNKGTQDNKWSMTIFARKPETGEAVWGYQMTPFDQWDYDGINEPILTELDGKPVLVHFDRNGFAYVLDRRDGTLIHANKYVNVDWAEKIDMKTGRPIKVKEHSPFELNKPIKASPSAMGGKDQQPCANDPNDAKIFFCPTNNWYMEDEPKERGAIMTGIVYVFANVAMKAEKPGNLGNFKAFDVTTGKTKWEIHEKFPTWGGALVTDGGLVFYGTLDGWFRAVDKENGKILWSRKLASGIIGNPITYKVAGHQYVSVFAGIGGWIGLPISAGLDPADPFGALGAVGLAYENGFDKIPTGGMLYTFRVDGGDMGKASVAKN
ncbi:MAG: PQQ-dependent dehydrogenase, methanol/ethanol family [Dokdonella sp.]|uniref:PQQ-dependent dehydrogenase, methanol/ethanol family n=1 Tax=Dokdonella sp. TaxID=2291710 RepID=UPI0032653B1F